MRHLLRLQPVGDLRPELLVTAPARRRHHVLVQRADEDEYPVAALPEKLAHEDGSWQPDGAWGADGGGRIMYTSLSLLTLEVYYRHVPLYRRPPVGDDKDK